MSELEGLGVGASAAGVGIYAIKRAIDGLDRLFGPMTDEIAGALQRWASYQLQNVGRVTSNADKKTSAQMLESGSIPFRAGAKILEEAASADQEIIVEYLGGVLASSRSPTGRDDRGVALTSTISRLSSYDLRAHYIFYSSFRRLLLGRTLNIYDDSVMYANRAWFPMVDFYLQMDLSETESFNNIMISTSNALKREDLIQVEMSGNRDHLRSRIPNAPDSGIIARPTVSGVQLYMWALGLGNLETDEYLNEAVETAEIEGVQAIERAQLISELPPI